MSIVELHVEQNKGLSHAIDKALDTYFKKDVKLNADQWQSVFNTITENEQAEQTQANQKQFDKEKDKDINNKSQYKVNQGIYVLTNETWNKIIDFVDKIVNPKVDETKTETETETKTEAETKAPVTTTPVVPPKADEPVKEPATIEDYKAKVCEYLGISVEEFEKKDAIFQSDVLRKYETMLSIAKQNGKTLDKDTLKTRINNYVKGWEYHNLERLSIIKKQTSPIEVHSKKADEQEIIKGYTDLANGYIEYYDRNGDGNIDVSEMLLEEAYDDYRFGGTPDKNRLKGSESYVKAMSVYNDYRAGKLQPNKDGTYEERLLNCILDRFAMFDSKTTAINLLNGDDDAPLTDNILERADIITVLYEEAHLNKKGRKEKDNEISSKESLKFNTFVSANSPKTKQSLLNRFDDLFELRK